jgi:hypothetical protein
MCGQQDGIVWLWVQDGKFHGEWPIDLHVHDIEVVEQGPLEDKGFLLVVDMAMFVCKTYFCAVASKV